MVLIGQPHEASFLDTCVPAGVLEKHEREHLGLVGHQLTKEAG
jgi:hypothetical protein